MQIQNDQSPSRADGSESRTAQNRFVDDEPARSLSLQVLARPFDESAGDANDDSPGRGLDSKNQELEIRGQMRVDFLKHLNAANIHRGSLFPGLEGFARSLDLDLQLKMSQLTREMTNQAERFRFADESSGSEEVEAE